MFQVEHIIIIRYEGHFWKVRSIASQLQNALIKMLSYNIFWKLDFNGYKMVYSLSKKYSAHTCSACSKLVGGGGNLKRNSGKIDGNLMVLFLILILQVNDLMPISLSANVFCNHCSND